MLRTDGAMCHWSLLCQLQASKNIIFYDLSISYSNKKCSSQTLESSKWQRIPVIYASGEITRKKGEVEHAKLIKINDIFWLQSGGLVHWDIYMAGKPNKRYGFCSSRNGSKNSVRAQEMINYMSWHIRTAHWLILGCHELWNKQQENTKRKGGVAT